MGLTIRKKIFFNILFLLLLFIISIIILEVTYRIIYKIKPDIFDEMYWSAGYVSLDYGDTREKQVLNPGGYLKKNFADFVKGGYGKAVWWQTNSLGFRNDYEITEKPLQGVTRILSLGDSFTAGYRIGQDQTFSHLLENYYNKKDDGRTYEVLISCIEEPTTGFFYLSNWGINFNPDVIIIGITLGNDIVQSYIGLDNKGKYVLNDTTAEISRNQNKDIFRLKHSLENHMIPKECLSSSQTDYNRKFFDEFLKSSATYRLIRNFSKTNYNGEAIISMYGEKSKLKLHDGTDGLGYFLDSPPSEIKDAFKRLFRILNAYIILSKKHSFKLIVILFPQRFQVQDVDWTATVKHYHLEKDCFDLMKPNNKILDFCAKNSIDCIDPTMKMKAIFDATRKSLYLPNGDMHWNAHGNVAVYESIKDKIYEIIAKDSY